MVFEIKNICCIGAGYVGGPTMAVFASKCPNLIVNVVDINEKRISDWNDEDLSNLPIYEPGLSNLIEKCRNKNLFFSNDVKNSVAKADMIFISVNTPTKKTGFGSGQALDLRWIEECSREIAKYASGSTIVVEKSTLPVKTASKIKEILTSSLKDQSLDEKLNTEKKFFILSNPEFLAEGSAINDLETPDRVLIGGENKEAVDALSKIYLNWVPSQKILKTNIWSSELSKLVSNAFLAQRVSSINATSAICEKTGADIKEVSLAIGLDRRIGERFLNSGPGFGGSCFKKDILSLVYLANFYGLSHVANYWEQVIKLNEWQQSRITKQILESLFGTISGKKLAILGFAFKADTNDTRESPAINICKYLIEEGSILNIYDPKVKKDQIQKDLNFEDFKFTQNILETVQGVDGIVILTDWEEFRSLNYGELYNSMRKPSWIFDCRGVINKKLAIEAGFKVWVVGNGK